MAKLTLTALTSAYQAVPALNANNDLIEAALENTLSRDGTTPNTMGDVLDMNSNRIINLSQAINGSDAVSLTQLNALLAAAAGATLTGPIAATLISIADAGGFYGAVDVEGALQEIFVLLASVVNGEGASLIGVEDAAANFTGTDLEAVLAELAAVSVSSATTTTEGIIELATQTEVNTGTDAVRAVTPATFAGRQASESRDGIIELATQGEVDTGTDTARAVTPATLTNFSGLGGDVFSFSAEKTVNETLNLNTTLQDDDDLNLGTIPNGTYRVELLFFFGATTTAGMGIKHRLDFSGVTSRNQLHIDSRINNAADQGNGIHNIDLTDTETTITVITTSDWVHMIGTMTVTTPGVLKLQWAQRTSNANNLTVAKNSFLTLQRIP